MSSGANKGLGKGLGALLQSADPISEEIKGSVINLKINDISPNREQPRKMFDQDKLSELAASIRENGVIQPIIVCRSEKGYQIVTGERRWRAARMAGLTTIPAIIRELTDVQILQQALIENIQRQDLNPLEEAAAFERLIKEYGMTQEKLSSVIGRSRSAIANTIRLLNLPDDIKSMVQNESISAGHARALLSLNEADKQSKAAQTIMNKNLSVRETEQLVKSLNQPTKKKKDKPDPAYVMSVRDVEERLTRSLGTKVKLKDRQGKGTIQIEYYTKEDLERLIDLLENL